MKSQRCLVPRCDITRGRRGDIQDTAIQDRVDDVYFTDWMKEKRCVPTVALVIRTWWTVDVEGRAHRRA